MTAALTAAPGTIRSVTIMSTKRPWRIYIFGSINRGRMRRYLTSYSTKEKAEARVEILRSVGYNAVIEER
jgi:hypothetical protein